MYFERIKLIIPPWRLDHGSTITYGNEWEKGKCTGIMSGVPLLKLLQISGLCAVNFILDIMHRRCMYGSPLH